MRSRQKILSVLISGLFVAPSAFADETPSAKSKAVEVGTISIVGEGDKLGTGLIEQEDTPKARGNVTRASVEKARPTANFYQLLELLPGINTANNDATGLFGGAVSIRGFNNEQLGVTINGAPVNDSGNFAVFPQQYGVDPENLCQLFVTQGSTDSDAPHVGASGGNLGLVTCDPNDKSGVRAAQTLGENNLRKTFVRGDIGKLFDGRFKAFVSASKSKADKWRGHGDADITRFSAGAEWMLSPGNRISLSALNSKQVNYNFKSVSKIQYQAFGRHFDFLDTFAGHPTPTTGTAQTESFSSTTTAAPVTAQNNAFYKLSYNPARYELYTMRGNFHLRPDLRFDFEPYFIHTYATGGTQQNTLRENAFLNQATGATNAARDLNGDGDTLDTLIIARSNTTQTHRPGATARLNYQGENHKLTLGYWFERARHRQTAPGVLVDNNGDPADLWLENSRILRPDGSTYQNRDQLTVSIAQEAFVQDSMNFINDKLNITVGARAPQLKREFTNYPSEGSGTRHYYVEQSFSDTLPSLGIRYMLTPISHVFFNIAKNFKAPANGVYQNLPFANGEVVFTPANIKPETSINTDLGYRFQGPNFTFSGSIFNVDFRNRLANAFDQNTGLVMQTNVGPVEVRGAELEVGTRPFSGWSAYLSYSYTESTIQEDLRSAAATNLPTSGKDFVNTPRRLFGASVQYATGPFYGQLQAKYTGKVFSTLTNDESIPGYTVVNLNLGYRLRDMVFLKNQTLRVNVSNIFDKDYLTSPSITNNATGAGASAPTYLIGAPRFVSVTYGMEF